MLETLLDNPFIIIILLGIISSLFGKGNATNKEQEQQRKQRQPQPQLQPRKMTQPQVPRREIQRERVEPFDHEKRVQPTVFETVQVEIESEFEQQRQAHAKKLKALEDERNAIENKVDDIHSGLQKKRQMTMPTQVNTTNDPLPSYGSRLVDGIVLSEILGKPRAKNPHRDR